MSKAGKSIGTGAGVAMAMAVAVVLASFPARAQSANPYTQPQQAQPQYVQQPIYVQPTYVQPVYAQPPAMPKVIRNYEEGDRIPPGYHPDTRPRLGLAIGGGCMFGVFYVFTAIGGAAALDLNKSQAGTSDAVLLIPVVGPFIRTVNNDALASVLLVIDGLAQAGGLAMLIGGIAAPKTVLVRNDIGVRVTPEPLLFAGGGGGVGLRGTF